MAPCHSRKLYFFISRLETDRNQTKFWSRLRERARMGEHPESTAEVTLTDQKWGCSHLVKFPLLLFDYHRSICLRHQWAHFSTSWASSQELVDPCEFRWRWPLQRLKLKGNTLSLEFSLHSQCYFPTQKQLITYHGSVDHASLCGIINACPFPVPLPLRAQFLHACFPFKPGKRWSGFITWYRLRFKLVPGRPWNHGQII